MVHALEEAHRVLRPGGVLIDIRPINDRWPVEVASSRDVQQTGRMDDLPDPLSADRASNEAMREAEARGWFVRELEQVFPFYYSWDTPAEMETFLTEDWEDCALLGEEARKSTRAAWTISDADSRVRVRVKILITRWKKIYR